MWKLLRTQDDPAGLIARVGLAIVMFPHGAQKVLGWFGGPGLHGTMQMFTAQMHLSPILAGCAIAAEFLGSLGLFFGLFSRLAAFAVAVDMAAAVYLVHWKVGFFMNWLGQQAGEGFEYHLLAVALACVVMAKGGGRFSLDRLLVGASAQRQARATPSVIVEEEPLTV